MTEPRELKLLPVEAGNHLIFTTSKNNDSKGRDNEDIFYDEVTPAGLVVAKYCIWHHMSIYPPQKTNNGWKKMDLDGNTVSQGKL